MSITPRALLAGAALTGVAFAGVYEVAYQTHRGGQIDDHALLAFGAIRLGIVTHAARIFQSACEPGPYLALCIVVLAVVLAVRGVVLTTAALVLVATANASAEALKPLIASASGFRLGPEAIIGIGSFPSGHATAAMSLSLAVMIVTPVGYRGLATLAGGLFALAVCWSELVLGSHLPSDVIGGCLVATFWALVVLAGLVWLAPGSWLAGQPRPPEPNRVPAPSLATATAALVIVGSSAVALAVLRLRPVALQTSPLVEFAVVGVLLTLLVAGLTATVAALKPTAR